MTLFCDYFSVKSNIGLELSLTQMLFSFLLIKKKIYIYIYIYIRMLRLPWWCSG